MEVALGYYEDSDDEAYDINTTRPPASGIEYLKQVQYETSQQPQVVTAQQYINNNNNNNNHNSNNNTQLTGTGGRSSNVAVVREERRCADAAYVPDELSQSRTACEFANLRQAFARFKAKRKSKISEGGGGGIRIPIKKDIDTWCTFCFGNELTKRIPNNDDEQNNSVAGRPPLLGLLCQINQPLTILLLDYHLAWFNRHGFTSQQGRWLYGLLLLLDKPTPPDAISCLRNICRKFQQFRVKAAADGDVDLLYQLYFFIVVVSRCFSQADLALS